MQEQQDCLGLQIRHAIFGDSGPSATEQNQTDLRCTKLVSHYLYLLTKYLVSTYLHAMPRAELITLIMCSFHASIYSKVMDQISCGKKVYTLNEQGNPQKLLIQFLYLDSQYLSIFINIASVSVSFFLNIGISAIISMWISVNQPT